MIKEQIPKSPEMPDIEKDQIFFHLQVSFCTEGTFAIKLLPYLLVEEIRSNLKLFKGKEVPREHGATELNRLVLFYTLLIYWIMPLRVAQQSDLRVQ